jgi:hypothetical protein
MCAVVFDEVRWTGLQYLVGSLFGYREDIGWHVFDELAESTILDTGCVH